MTTYTTARDTLVGLIHSEWVAQYPNIPVFYENTVSVDMDSVGPIFLFVSVDFMDAVQSDIDMPDQGFRANGEVCLRLFLKEGEGTRKHLAVFDYMGSIMKLRSISGVYTQVPYPGRKTNNAGWMSHDLLCPFVFYSKF